jgi:phage terminase large subunit
MLKRTTAQVKIAKLNKRIRIVRGGTSASKTFSIIPFLINYAIQNSKVEISVVAETIPHLRRGALRDFLKIMDMTGMYRDAQFNKSNLTYIFNNGSFIEFFSADNPSKLRGARRDVLFINECNNVTFESYYQLAIRTRKFIYLDYNPVSEFWVDTEVTQDKDSELVTLTYKDNEALDKSIVQEIEKARDKSETSKYWANWWRVYGLGLTGTLEGVVFPDIEIVDVVPDPLTCQYHGLDFGWNDETALVSRYKYKDGYLLHQRYYKGNTLTARLADVLRTLEPKNIIADREAKQTIMDLKMTHGINKIQGYTTAGKDGKQSSIDKMKASKIYVTATSLELIEDFRGYRLIDGEYVGRHHGIDAARYTFMAGVTAGAKAFGNF